MPQSTAFVRSSIPRMGRATWGGLVVILAACGDTDAPRATEAEPAPISSRETPGPAIAREDSADDFRIDAARRLMQSGRFDLAEAALRTVLAEKPTSDRAKFFLAVSIAKQKRYGEARPLYEEAQASARRFPEETHLDHFLGWTQYYLGDPAAARESFLRHAESVPAEGDSAFALGLIALDADDRADAERWFTEAIRRQQDEPALAREVAKAHARLGDVRWRDDRIDEAVESWRQCVAMWPDHHEAWSKLARAYARLGREADAAMATRQWEAALARVGRGAPDFSIDDPEGDRP
jgi:tetratricopeptide (TPR) repeat protein